MRKWIKNKKVLFVVGIFLGIMCGALFAQYKQNAPKKLLSFRMGL